MRTSQESSHEVQEINLSEAVTFFKENKGPSVEYEDGSFVELGLRSIVISSHNGYSCWESAAIKCRYSFEYFKSASMNNE